MTTTTRGTRRGTHRCVVYDDPTLLRQRAVEFLAEGLRAGEAIWYLASGDRDPLYAELSAVPGFDELFHAGLGLLSLDEHYGPDEVVDGPVSVAAYAAGTEQALAAGYAGLRVAAEATALVHTVEQREAFTRYEHLVDRYMAANPFSALCAYDSRELGAATAELACLHPLADGDSGFRWYAGAEADVHLAGEVDMAVHALFDRTLDRTLPLHTAPRVVVDAGELEFIDHRGLLTLDRSARAAGAELHLRSDSTVVRRMADLLELEALTVGGWSR